MPSARLRIAFVIDDLGFGGAQRQLAALAGALSAFVKPRVYSMSTIVHPFADRIRDAGVPVLALERRGHADFVRFVELCRALSRDKADVVHGFLDASNVYSYFAARRIGVPVVLSLRNDRLRVRGLKARVLRYALRRAERVVVNSRSGERYLTAEIGLPAGKVILVRNVVVSRPARDAKASGTAPPEIGFVGRLVPQKRVELLVDAFELLRRRHPDARLIIVGEGENRGRLEAQVRQKALDEATEFTGAIENVADKMARFSCLVLPSVHEGQPNVVLEALSLGVPVVTSPVGDLQDVVFEGRTGLMFHEPTAEALANAIDRLLRDDSIRRRAAVEGPKLIAERYSAAAAVERLLGVYNAVVGGS